MRRTITPLFATLLIALTQLAAAAPAEIVGTYTGTFKGKNFTQANAIKGVAAKGPFTLTIQANDTWTVVIGEQQFTAGVGGTFAVPLSSINVNGSVTHFNLSLHFNGDKVTGAIHYSDGVGLATLLEGKFKATKQAP